tara:strand:+ start:27706 stop:29370 length:1665 start_codon:yes stop_codon:yes gene_type:complete
MKAPLKPWQRFIKLLQLDKRDIRQLFYYAVIAGLIALSLPLGIQAIINLIQGAQVSTSWIILVILVTLGVAFQGILQLMQIRILENIQQRIFTRSSFEFAYRLPKIKSAKLKHTYPPELANRFFDTLTVQKGLSKVLLDFPAAILQIFFGLILLSFYHPFFIAYGVMLVILVYIVFKLTAVKGLETSLEESKKKYKVAHWLQEIARSMVSFKLSGRTSLAMDRNNNLTDAYLESRENHFKILMSQFIQLITFKVLVTAGLLIIGGFLVLNQQMNIGQFVAAEIIILLVIGSVEKLFIGVESFYDVLTSLEKIGEVVDKELEESNGLDPFRTDRDLYIQLLDVSYSTTGIGPILKNISLDIKHSDRILIVGPSGSGKTTLIKILSKLIDISSGNIYINDISIKGINFNEYRSNVGQVLPEQNPFEGTILENITFGNNDISVEEVNKITNIVGLTQFIKRQPYGLATKIFPEGQEIPHTVSKQILLARAIVHKPKLLMLKDALEHFDHDLAKSIIQFLSHPERPWALIVSSSNKDWIPVCNKIMNLGDSSITSKDL